MKTKQILGWLVCSVLSTAVYAQTSNLGELTVLSGTEFSVLNAFTNTDTASFINDGDTYFYRNFSNNGIVDHTGLGATYFVGDTPQQLNSPSTSYFSTMVVNNISGVAAALELDGAITVERELVFTDGVFNTLNQDADLTLTDDTTVSDTNDNSFVDGFVRKIGDDDFVFPVGDDTYYRYMAVSAPANTTANYKARYVYEDTNSPYSTEYRIGNVVILNDKEYWELENTSGVETVEVTLSWDEDTTPIDITTGPEEYIRMARWDFTQGAWREVLGATVDTFNNEISAFQEIDGLAVFSIARAESSIILPDNVIVWNGVSPNNDNDNDYFYIQGIENLANNKLTIFNRWGTKVFDTVNYDSTGNIFNGRANGRSELLPSGTYFYVLEYDTNTGERIEKAGYLYLSTD